LDSKIDTENTDLSRTTRNDIKLIEQSWWDVLKVGEILMQSISKRRQGFQPYDNKKKAVSIY
jgi:hypothetical protein